MDNDTCNTNNVNNNSDVCSNVNEDNDNIEGSLAIYVIKSGGADAIFDGNKIARFGHGSTFGEGAVLFNRAHSATVVSNDNKDGDELLCWVVPADVFRSYVLQSANMVTMFNKYCVDESEKCMDMTNFVKSCTSETIYEQMQLKISNTHNILRKPDYAGIQKISLSDFCLFHCDTWAS